MSEPTRGDMIRVQGNKEYLPVPARVQWMRGDHPDWGIDTAIIELNWAEGYVVMRAEVRDDTGRLIGAGTKTETRKGFPDFVEKAETGAVGRALARAGYGTEDALDLEGDRFADAPIEQPQGGERVDRRGGVSRQPATTRPGVQRTAEEQALLDELLAFPGITYAQMHLLADAVGVPTGQHANADQLREMIARMTTPSAGVPTPDGQGEADGSVSASPASDTPQPVGDSPAAATAPAGALSPPPQSVLAPTLDDVLAVTGGELLPPQPGTPEYKALVATEKARARAHWQKREVKP